MKKEELITDNIIDYSKSITNGLEIITFEMIKKIIDNNDKWLEGEYKWMPTFVTTMPEGWVKVLLEKGFTLIKENTEGFSLGENIKHVHHFENIGSFIPVAKNGISWSRGDYQDGGDTFYATSYGWATIWREIPASGSEVGNLPAGIFATLWQYDPQGTFTKAREKAISEQLKKRTDNLEIKAE